MHIPRKKSERLGLHALNKLNKIQKFVKKKDVTGTLPGLALDIARTATIALPVGGAVDYFTSPKAGEIVGGVILGVALLLSSVVHGRRVYLNHQARKTTGYNP